MCDCVRMVNRELRKHNTEISLVDLINMKTGQLEQRMTVPTAKITKKRGTAMKVFATFCPMCGEKFPETGFGRSAESELEKHA